MTLPTISELREAWKSFVAAEQLTWRSILLPSTLVRIMIRHRFVHFLVIGGGGAALGLGTTWALTQFVFGLEGYYSAYLIGTGLSLCFNFSMYSLVLFRTSKEHVRRLVVYFAYICAVIVAQATLVKIITPVVGLRWYLFVIAFVIGVFSMANFLVFKLAIFKERASV